MKEFRLEKLYFADADEWADGDPYYPYGWRPLVADVKFYRFHPEGDFGSKATLDERAADLDGCYRGRAKDTGQVVKVRPLSFLFDFWV